VAAGGVVVVLAAAGVVLAASDGSEATPTAQEPSASTEAVQVGPLASVVSLNGTLTYEARPDGSPYPVINQAQGTYTSLPAVGAKVGCGRVLYRVDDRPVLLLCGTVPAYRDLHEGDTGRDVRQLNRALHVAGGRTFTARTKAAVQTLQRRTGAHVDGELVLGDAVFVPGPARIAKVAGELGAAARPGAPVLAATSDTLRVQVDLDASQQDQVRTGDRARITLPGNRSATGRVARIGRVAQVPDGQGADPAAATIPASIRLDHPAAARGLDHAPVQVDVATKGVARALSVPVDALVGKAGGGLAVEVVRTGGRRELVGVRVGLFDDAQGRVEVEGDLHAGDRVAVPSL
jgi:hypothetical protein